MIEFIFMGLLYLLILYFVFWVGIFVSRLWFPIKAFIYLVTAFVGYQMVLEASGVFAVAATLFTGVCFFILPYLGIVPSQVLEAGFIGIPRYFWESFLAKRTQEKINKYNTDTQERMEREEREARERAREREKIRQEAREDDERYKEWQKWKEWAEKGKSAEELKYSDLDPYEVLGVSKSASEGEVKKRKNEMLIKYHPDTVASYGAEVQKQAEAMTKLINWAVNEILKK